MFRFLLIFLCGLLGIGLLGCTVDPISNPIDGFEIIDHGAIVDKDIIDWIDLYQHDLGFHKKVFPSGNYLMITLVDHKEYVIKKVNIQKYDHGYQFNITVATSNIEDKLFDSSISSPIIVKTPSIDQDYQIKIIYQ